MKSGLKQSPQPPSEARDGPARPQPNGRSHEQEDTISIPTSEFYRICKELRVGKLSGPPAADALEAAAGLSDIASPQGAKPKELRSKVQSARDDEGGGEAEEPPEKPKKPKKKAMMFAAEEPDEIPELPPAVEVEEEPAAAEDEQEEVVLNLNQKQNKLRSDLELWVMDNIVIAFGVEDSDELEENLQEDAQADKITQLIAENANRKCGAGHPLTWFSKKSSEDAQCCLSCNRELNTGEPLNGCKQGGCRDLCIECAGKVPLTKRNGLLEAWVKDAAEDARADFIKEVLGKLAKIDDADDKKVKVLDKKKKKKKAAEAEPN